MTGFETMNDFSGRRDKENDLSFRSCLLSFRVFFSLRRGGRAKEEPVCGRVEPDDEVLSETTFVTQRVLSMVAGRVVGMV